MTELTVYTDNAAAVALYRKFGFGIEGTARGYALRRGEYVGAFMMARHAPAPAHRAPPDASGAGNA
jgi:putative acetyltransferase